MLTLRKAIDTYLEEAYGGNQLPGEVERLLKYLEPQLDQPEQLLQDDELEHPQPDMVSLRLGNHAYPHMKLVVRVLPEGLLFSVDTHDGPDRIPPTLPGYNAFRPVLKRNGRIRDRIHRKLRNLETEVIVERSGPYSRGDVLVVDDEPFVGEIMGRLLKSLQFRVHYAASAPEGRSMLRHQRFVCCFLDIMMPGESGYEFLEQIAADNLRTCPVIFVTGMHPDNIRHELADETILKPFTRAMLQDKLERLGLLETAD